MTALATLNRRMAADIRPHRRARPFGDFCRTLRLPDGKHAGHLWVPETEPSQAAFIRHVESGKWRQFTIVAPTQRGKTLKAILSPLLYATTERRQSVAYVLPSLDLLAKNWDGKIKPAIEGTGFGDWLPTKGPGSKGGKPAVLTLRDPVTGIIAARAFFMATGVGKRESSTASIPCQVALYDEADDALDDGTIKRVYKRTESFGADGMAFGVSTVNDIPGRISPDVNDPDAAHPILMLERQGSRHRLHHRCPHCAGRFVPKREHLDLERKAIACPICAVIWSEDDRHDALNKALSAGSNDTVSGDLVIEGKYDHFHYSEITTGLDYHMADIKSIAEELVEATKAEKAGRFSLMRTCMHKVFCQAYVEPKSDLAITNDGLAGVSSLSDYDKRIVPHWVTHLTAAVDVQDNRHYWGVAGIGPDDRWCVVDWGYEMLVPFKDGKPERPPTAADRRRVNVEIDAKFNAGWPKEGSGDILSPLPGLRGIDVGDGEVTAEIVGWLRGMRGWRAVRGADKDGFKRLGKIIELPPEAKAFVELREPDGWPIPLCNVLADTVRKWVHASLLRPAYTPASGMLPRGLKSKEPLLLHLSGKVWRDPEVKQDGTLVEGKWITLSGRRHDWLDVFTYALALSRFRIGLQTVNANRPRVRYGRLGPVNATK